MKTLFRRTLLCAALSLVTLPALAQSSPESPFTRTIFFGDSLTDGGFFRPLLPASSQSVTGQFTTNPGYVWSQYMADYFHSNADVAWKATGATPAKAGGNNWAVGGARIKTDSVGGLGYTPSLVSQYNAYLAAGNTVDPNALYSIWGGANDVFQAITDYQTAYFIKMMGGGTAAQADAAGQAAAGATLSPAISGQIGLIGALKTAGAQYILVPTLPDMGLTPSAAAGGAAGKALASGLSNNYNTALFGGLASAGLHVIPVDTYHFLQEVVANPAQFGLTNVTGVACLTQPAPAGDSSLFCNPLSTVPNGANTYLFADGVHPTSGAHKALADLAVSMIDGPRQIAVLPHSAAMVGRSRASMVDATVSSMAMSKTEGMQWWADLRGDQQRFNQSAGFDGIGGTGSFGVGWHHGSLVYGAFAGYGRANIDFGFDRGKFRQTDASIGGFIGWAGDGLWANGQLSWTKLGYKVDRRVELGQAVRVHSGSPDGRNLSAGASAGWAFKHGNWQHGPVLSLLYQDISVDGYAENSTQSSALAFAKQDGKSLLGSAGWQASYSINEHLQPFTRVVWNHEYKSAPAQVWAQSQSLTNTLPYAVPGVAFDNTYGTLTVGLRTQAMGMDVTAGSNLSINQKGGHDASFFLTVGGGF
ncbi:MAG: autotransporter domain-containing protein [Xanthomonadaceae bacterium]|nr:autotransporter domain-containing protein [Xanthomonadaceae bacterium]